MTPIKNTSTMAQGADSKGNALEMIGIRSRIPQFWRDKPRLWFAQFETMIASQKLGDENKFGMVVAQLEKTDVEQISDIILAPPNTGRYETIKNRLLTVYEESEEIQLRKLLNEIDLGDQRPTQLLRRMRDLARSKIPDDTLRMLWMSHLPKSTRAVLSVSQESSLDALANMADKMHEQTREVNSVCSCQGHASTSQQPPALLPSHDVISMIEALTKEVAALRADSQNYRRQPYRGRNRSRSNSAPRRYDSNETSGTCYFHRKFGRAAYRCRSPCSFHTKKNGGQERSGN